MFRKNISATNEWLLFLNIALLLCCAALLFKTSMYVIAKEEISEVDEEFYDFARTFNEVYNLINSKYIDIEKVKAKDLYEGALEGMFRKLDPYSQYMGPDHFQQLTKETEGQFSGIGIYIGLRDQILTVISPIPGSPAARAGLQPWDRIIKIEDKTTEGISMMEAVRKLTGPQGTTVSIQVFRVGSAEPLDFTIERDVIKVESVYYKIMEEDIGYVRVAKFSANTTRDLKKALVHFKKNGCTGLLMDLRFNSGGLLNEALEMSDLFLDEEDVIVSTRGRDKDNDKEYRARQNSLWDGPMIVLVNQGSASASEIFAGAMQDHNRAMIIGPKGQKTFGKASVQTIEALNFPFQKDEDGNPLPSAVRITTARYFTPSGTLIREKGISPDIEFEISKEEERDILVEGMLLGDVRADEEPDYVFEKEASDDSEGSGDSESSGDSEGADDSEEDAAEDMDIEPDPELIIEPEENDDTPGEENTDAPDKEDEDFYIDILKNKNGSTTATTTRKDKKDLVDHQLQEALKYIRVMIFTNKSQAA